MSSVRTAGTARAQGMRAASGPAIHDWMRRTGVISTLMRGDSSTRPAGGDVVVTDAEAEIMPPRECPAKKTGTALSAYLSAHTMSSL